MKRAPRKLIVPIAVLLAVVLPRLFWLSAEKVISNDGAEYARIAQNLLAGRGYTGLMPGPELTFPPLYPLLMSLGALLGGSADSAGRGVSLIMGMLLFVPLWGIVHRLYGSRTAFIAIAIAAIHPLFVELSAEVFSEATFVALYLAGLHFAFLSIERPGPRYCAPAGVFFGLSYLTRPEALLHLCIVVLVLFFLGLRGAEKRRRTVLGIVAMVLLFAVFAAPYAAYLTSRTGRLTFEGKLSIHQIINQRLQEGMPDGEARCGINEELDEEGPLLDLVRYVREAPYPSNPTRIARYVLEMTRRNTYAWLYFGFWDRTAILPFLGIMTIIGLASGPWNAQRFRRELLLLSATALFTVTLLCSSGVTPRFLFPAISLVVVWASRGVDRSSVWLWGAARRLGWAQSAGNGRKEVIPFLCIYACFAFLSVRGLSDIWSGYSNDAGRLALRDAGVWLRDYDSSDKTVMSVRTTVPYYSGAVWMPSPCAREELALRYIRKKAPDYVVLSGISRDASPYLERWLLERIPDESFTLVYARGDTPREMVRIYRYRL